MGQKENNSPANKKAAQEEEKRPGSAVSREFQPNRQQKAGTLWRKQQQQQEGSPQQQQKQQQIYGFVPFKNAAAMATANHHAGAQKQGASIYGSASIRPSNPPPHPIHPASDYLHSIYAPPQLVRQHQNRGIEASIGGQQQIGSSSSSGGIRGAQIQHQGPVEMHGGGNQQQQAAGGMGSRPGSDLGMYKIMSSRCQSYTTLPRPEHGAEMFEELGPASFAKSQPQIIYGTRDGSIQLPFRPPSAASRSLGRKNSTAAAPLPPAYFGGSNIFAIGHPSHLEPEYGLGERADGHKEVIPWSTVSLGSWLTIVFGAAIFCLGAVRLYWRADYAKGQEIFYGISAICNGLVGFFASQNRSFCMFVAAFLMASINTIFIFVPFLSGILPLVPLLSSKPYISLGGTKEPVEVDIGLAVLSLMQLAAAFSLLLYGCRAFGTSMKHVEQMRMATIITQQQQQMMNASQKGGGDSGGGMGGKI